MGTLGLSLFRQREMKIQREKVGGYNAGERGRGRAHGKFAAVLSVLAFVFLLTSIISPPLGYATFPGANGKILFESTRDGGDMDIFTMNPDGSGVTQLTNNSGIEDRYASWSADGTRIVYSSTQDGGDFDIWVMNADGSNKTQLTFNSADDAGPVWSPDGTKIAFDSTLDGDYEIYVMNADGTGQTQLTFNSIFDLLPAWSPDGTTIAFVSGVNQGAGSEIWKMNADGSGKTQLTSNSVQDTSVSWTPDGSKLLFRRDLGFGAGWGEMFSMNADGTEQTNITNTATIFDGDGSFSPDGTKIVFSSNENDPDFDVWVMNADGTGRARLTNTAGTDIGVDWQPLLTIIAQFTITTAKVEFNEYLTISDSFKVKGEFTLGANSNGIDPLNEDVVVSVGASTITIPAGSFTEEKSGEFVFKGTINDAVVEMKIKQITGDTYKLKVKAEGVDLRDTSNPVDIDVTIGDDTGIENAWLEGKLMFGNDD